MSGAIESNNEGGHRNLKSQLEHRNRKLYLPTGGGICEGGAASNHRISIESAAKGRIPWKFGRRGAQEPGHMRRGTWGGAHAGEICPPRGTWGGAHGEGASKIYENLRKSATIYENLRKSTKICENL